MGNFVVMPMFFLSGAMYPVDKAPDWIKLVIKINPAHYGVDLIRSTVLGLPMQNNIFLNLFFLLGFIIVILSFAIYFFHKYQG